MQNKQLIPIKQELTTTATIVTSLKIKTQADMDTATSVRSNIKRYSDTLDTQRKLLTKPLDESKKNIMAMFRPLEDTCKTLLKDIDTKMFGYNSKQQAKQQAIADKLMANDITATQALKQMDKASTEKTVTTAEGSVTFTKVKKFRIMDPMMIFVKEILDHNKAHKDFIIDHEAFNKYFVPNEVAIRQAMLAGMTIPGVEYYEESSIRNKR